MYSHMILIPHLGRDEKKNQNLNEFVEGGFRIQLFPKNFAGAP